MATVAELIKTSRMPLEPGYSVCPSEYNSSRNARRIIMKSDVR
jgi:hypothetical protein